MLSMTIFHDDRQFGLVAALLANPAPVSARLFAGDDTLFADRDSQARFV